eukprot:CAMPEP_0168607832 /NCGR_PEP_ID=MMETSP0449_2-20121227/282_1 /TAXON_ID=1082188 /ORGANISM="Strombidium rassoulzadegani, Strain ras09" /LENGTH=68 /DNA_ID=CAMNT_0008647733 /DNA_START=400 /DNA_END=606 /DNA_ORIENTATION=-
MPTAGGLVNMLILDLPLASSFIIILGAALTTWVLGVASSPRLEAIAYRLKRGVAGLNPRVETLEEARA